MGGLCSEGHEFLRICKKRNPVAAHHMIDVLVTQHSRWTARRLHRALFGQSLINFQGDWKPESSSVPASSVSCRAKSTAPPQAGSISLERLARGFAASRESRSSEARPAVIAKAKAQAKAAAKAQTNRKHSGRTGVNGGESDASFPFAAGPFRPGASSLLQDPLSESVESPVYSSLEDLSPLHSSVCRKLDFLSFLLRRREFRHFHSCFLALRIAYPRLGKIFKKYRENL